MKRRQWIATLVVTVFVCVVAVGLWLARRSKPPAPIVETIVIQTFVDGLTSVEIEYAVTGPIEQSVARVEGVMSIESTSREGVSLVEVRVAPSADALKVRDAVLVALPINQLPEGASAPFVMQLARPAARWIWLSTADDSLRERLEATENVRAVSLCGTKRREVRVLLDETRLAANHLEPRDVIDALSAPKLVEADLAQAPIKTTRLADLAKIEVTESADCQATRGGAAGVLVSVDVGPNSKACDAKIRAEGPAFGFDDEAFRIDFGEGLKTADVDRMAREAGAKDVIVLEHNDPAKGSIAYSAVVLAGNPCEVATKLEQSLAKKTTVRAWVCGLNDDARSLRFVGPDLDVLSATAKSALATAPGAVGFIEGAEKGLSTTVELDENSTPDDRTRLSDALRLRSKRGIQVSVTEKGHAIVVAMPPGIPKLEHTKTSSAQMPIAIEHVENHRVVRLRFVGENARETAAWLAPRVLAPPGVIVLTGL